MARGRVEDRSIGLVREINNKAAIAAAALVHKRTETTWGRGVMRSDVYATSGRLQASQWIKPAVMLIRVPTAGTIRM
jgi:hypothetical protein